MFKSSEIHRKHYKINSSECIETFIDERHASGKDKDHISYNEWRQAIWNAREVNNSKERQLRETMHERKLDILCVPETNKKRCDTRIIGKRELES